MIPTASTPPPWVVDFAAIEGEVATLRRSVRAHLQAWGLPEFVDEAQLCVSELVANVITHVGAGTPTTLTVLMKDVFLRIEVQDPDTRVLPSLMTADAESESGRGMALVEAVTDRWGVQILADRKVTWCEIATVSDARLKPDKALCMTRAEVLIDLYCAAGWPIRSRSGRLWAAEAEETAILIITDLLQLAPGERTGCG
ncbi:ATP-binding protein [Streptomyces flaveolus]|uniref:ATP-binding protein n=1 Tax=Streptomyces flaveolus TaxID=67297 RepID=UPI0033B9449F